MQPGCCADAGSAANPRTMAGMSELQRNRLEHLRLLCPQAAIHRRRSEVQLLHQMNLRDQLLSHRWASTQQQLTCWQDKAVLAL